MSTGGIIAIVVVAVIVIIIATIIGAYNGLVKLTVNQKLHSVLFQPFSENYVLEIQKLKM